MPDDDIVCAATYIAESQAIVARVALEGDGIPCFIATDDCGGMRPYMQIVTGVKLMVREGDRERAEEILREVDGSAVQEDGEGL